MRLNRTFYGIETNLLFSIKFLVYRLNRTFYGIETVAERTGGGEGGFVLIVPFM